MNRSWVRFPQAAQKRPPLQGWALSSMYEAWAESAGERAVGLGVPSCGRTWLRVPGLGFAPCHYRGWAAWCARGRRPARSPSAPQVAACCPDRSPAAARPARPLAVRAASFARRVGSKPGQAPQASRRPPIGRGACVLPGQAPPPPTGTADHGVPQPGPPDPQCGLVRRAEIWGCSDACCYKRRQSEVFFVWISGPLLQTSSIRWLFH